MELYDEDYTVYRFSNDVFNEQGDNVIGGSFVVKVKDTAQYKDIIMHFCQWLSGVYGYNIIDCVGIRNPITGEFESLEVACYD